ncbi:MAG: hypothetical protein J1F27_08335, partial [Prevotellaceae bacterium]|nr:hypothetical protein [Prevotellaceae bacterium]
MKKTFLTFSFLICFLTGFAADAVTWSYKLVGDNTATPAIEATATIAPGYHMYSVDNPAGGSNPLEFYFDLKGCKLDGTAVANKQYITEFDDIFEVDQHFYEGSVTFTQKIIPTDKNFTVDLEIKGQACNDSGCVQIFGSHTFKGTSPVAAAQDAAPKDDGLDYAEGLAEMTDSLQAAEPFMTPEAKLNSSFDAHHSWWDNVEAELLVF